METNRVESKFSVSQQEQFKQQGYLLLKNVVSSQLITTLRDFVQESLNPLVGPVEYEVKTGYPGAPASWDAPGGETPRRLLHALARSPMFHELAGHPKVAQALKILLGSQDVLVSQCHHNCVMTKHPGFSSATLWHQDIRYWSFDEPNLISAWFGLEQEDRKNGSLRVIPQSHLLELDRGRLDQDLFLRPDLPENRQLIHQAVQVELDPGDVLLFHCKTFHAAGKNLSQKVKLSPVFTYHTSNNHPIRNTRSAQLPGIPIADLKNAGT